MEEINIQYQRPLFYKRVLANVVDALLCAFLGLIIFLSSMSIIKSTSAYKSAENRITNTQKNSGLYVLENYRYYDIVSYYKNDKTITALKHKELLSTAIGDFISYLDSSGLNESAQKVQKHYDEYRLGEKMVYEGVACFIKDSTGKIVENTECSLSYKDYAEKIYAVYIDNYATGYLITEVPNMYKDTRFVSNIIFLISIPVAIVLACALTYLVPPLIFKRGRKTIGKLIYKIGLVDSKCLNVSTGRFLIRYCIFFLAEIVLSVFSFCVPLLISFSMMCFSKNKQGFPDYMLGINEVETGDNKTYYSMDECAVDMALKQNKAPDFKMEERL